MDLGLRDKVAVVAAGSKGLGRGAALALAAEGCHVAICARGEDALRATASEIESYGVKAHAASLDIGDPDAPAAFVAAARAALGPICIVVANNGGPPLSVLSEADDDALRSAFDGNFFTTVRLARAALPDMKQAGWGRVVNITSAVVKEPAEGLGLSNTARAAVAGWATTIARELGPAGITVNTVAPGPFDTDRMRALGDILDQMRATVPVGRVGRAEELGALVAFLASDHAGYINGQTIVIDGGQGRSLM